MCSIFAIFSKKKFFISQELEKNKLQKHRTDYNPLVEKKHRNPFSYLIYGNIDDLIKGKNGNFQIVESKSLEDLTNKLEGEKANFFMSMSYFSIFGRVKSFDNMVFNGEVFNIEELKEFFNIKKINNDGELLEKAITNNYLNNLEAIFAIIYLKNKKVYLERDKFGVNPLFYYYDDTNFIIASENKTLDLKGNALNPRFKLIFNPKNWKIELIKNKNLFKIENNLLKNKLKEIKKNVKKLNKEIIYDLIEKSLIDSILKQSKQAKRVSVLFSGGLDSTFISKILDKNDLRFKVLISGAEGSKDLEIAEKIANEFSFDYEINVFDKEILEKDIKKIVWALESPNIMKVSVAIPLYYSSLKNPYKVVLSGIGSEEIFAGYERHKFNTKRERERGLLKIWERDLYRDNVINFLAGNELRVPFLNELTIYLSNLLKENDLIKKISKKELEIIKKIDPDFNKNTCKKYVLRKIAEKYIGKWAWRPKKAAQYGSKSEKLIEKIAKEKDFDKRKYLKAIFPYNFD